MIREFFDNFNNKEDSQSPFDRPFEMPLEEDWHYLEENPTHSAVNKGNSTMQFKSAVVTTEDGFPLVGAHIVDTKDPVNGTFTDNNGSFTIGSHQPTTLKISHIGFKTKQINFIDLSSKVVLEEDIHQLDEVELPSPKKGSFAWIIAVLIGLFLIKK